MQKAAAQPKTGAAFADAIAPHLDALYGYCLRLSNRVADAEDLLQETLLHGLRAHAGLRAKDRLRSWLFTIATNAWRDRLRARGQELSTFSLGGSDEEQHRACRSTRQAVPRRLIELRRIPHGLRNGAPGFNGWVTTAPTTAGTAASLVATVAGSQR